VWSVAAQYTPNTQSGSRLPAVTHFAPVHEPSRDSSKQWGRCGSRAPIQTIPDSATDCCDARARLSCSHGRDRQASEREPRRAVIPDRPVAFRDRRHHRHLLGWGRPIGVSVNSFTSVSLDPPLVLFCIGTGSNTWPRIKAAGHFTVNILNQDQEDLSRAFATKGAHRFRRTGWRPGTNGSPILDGCLAYIDCTIDAEHQAGDHVIVVGHVRELESSRQTRRSSSGEAATFDSPRSAPPGGSEARLGGPRRVASRLACTRSADRSTRCAPVRRWRSWVVHMVPCTPRGVRGRGRAGPGPGDRAPRA
jgi:flavin reductase (DIM6/NTAB) family NADH-FMN oxidoreductase RutF